jgi:hypothetical protein
MISKAQIIESIKELPEEFELDEIVERIILIEKINRSNTQINNGEYLTLSQFKEKAKEWQM